MSDATGFAALEARVHAIVDALSRDEVADDAGLARLARLVRPAHSGDSEGAGASADERSLARLQREWSEFSARALRELEEHAWVGGGPLRSHINAIGDVQLVVGASVSAAQRAAHLDEVQAVYAARARRLRLLATIVVTARRIAGLVVTPAGLISALPVALACVREAHARGEGTRADVGAGGIAWL